MRGVLGAIVRALVCGVLSATCAALACLAGEQRQWVLLLVALAGFGVGLYGELWAIADLVEWQHA